MWSNKDPREELERSTRIIIFVNNHIIFADVYPNNYDYDLASGGNIFISKLPNTGWYYTDVTSDMKWPEEWWWCLPPK